MNPMPASAIQRETSSGPSSISAPSASSTSALPAWLVAALLPCLATTTPAPRATNAAAVEMFMVPFASPPVPQVSTTPSGASTFWAKRRIARAKPTISPTDSPRTRKAVRSAAVTAGFAAPSMISSKARSASPAERASPAAAFLRVSRSKGLKLQEVLQEALAASREDAFRVELDPLDRQFLVPDAHDHTVLRPAGHHQALRHGLRLDDERVVARRLEALRQLFVHPFAVVKYLRGLAVDGLSRAHDFPPVRLPYRLVAEADAEYGNPLRGFLDHL